MASYAGGKTSSSRLLCALSRPPVVTALVSLSLPLYRKQRLLPFHSYSADALASPITHTDVPPDPPFVTSSAPPHLPALSASRTRVALHPLLLAQIRSVRPESAARPYVDWFADCVSLSRLSSPNSLAGAWSYNWSSPFHSLFYADPSLNEMIVAKVIADGATGTLIVPASQLAICGPIARCASLVLSFFILDVPHVAIVWDSLSSRASPPE